MQMNSEELKRELSLAFPSEIKGYKRPDEPISSGHDFFLELPQIIAKDPVLFSSMNLILSVLLSNDNLLKQWVNELEDALQAQDFKIVTEQVKGLMSPEMLKKLNGIATGANNYVHPSSHPATMITQDATHRFVTDTEKNTWNSKASTALVSTTANGLAPRRDGNNDHYLAGDGTWKAVNHANKSDNATNATNADTATKVINGTQYYLQSGNGDIDENNVISQNKANVVLGSWYSTGFRDLCSSGTPIRVAINHRNGNIKTTGAVTAPTFNGSLNGNAKTATSATTATKAIQDNRGQQIDTTYIKGVSGSNATITTTKGNGSTSNFTINNVSHSEYTDRIGTNKGYTGNTLGSGLATGVTYSNIYNNNFPFSYGNVLNIKGQGATQLALEWSGSDATAGRLAYRNARDSSINKWSPWKTVATIDGNIASATKATNDSNGRNIVNTYAPKASPAFSGTPTAPTPATTDNSTKIATTAFINNLINYLKNNNNLLGVSAASLTQNGYIKFTNGLLLQWGSVNALGKAKPWRFNYPITFSKNVFGITAIRLSGAYCYSEIIQDLKLNYLTWLDKDNNNVSGDGDNINFIIIGN